MKKGLIVLLIFVLVVGAFFAGANINLNNTNDLTTTALEENEKVDIDVNDTTEEMIIDKTTTKASTTEEETYSEYQPEGYEKMGKFNLIVEIVDFATTPGEETILVDVGHNDGFYLEYPYAADIFIRANYYELDLMQEEYSCIINDEKRAFEFTDNYTLLLSDDNDTKIIFDEIIAETLSGTIFKGHIDRYGYDKDESDIYYFATKYEDFNSLYSEDCGEPYYWPSGDFSHLQSKRIYL